MIENNNLDLSNNGILNNPNQNSFKEVSVIQSKEKESKSKKVSGKYFIFYISVIITIYVLLFINYLKTNNWYEENRHYINLRPFSICSEYISNLIFIYVLFFINYLKTNNWYEENRHYINLRPNII